MTMFGIDASSHQLNVDWAAVDASTGETWLSVPGHEGFYEVSDLGRVRSLDRIATNGHRRRGLLLRPTRPGSHGYLRVSLRSGRGRRRVADIHRLVLEAFAGPPPAGMVTRHLDGNPLNNVLANLCWGTPAENSQDILRHGRHKAANKTHCPRGHEYTPENTYRTVGRRPGAGRGCRECLKLRRQLQRERTAS